MDKVQQLERVVAHLIEDMSPPRVENPPSSVSTSVGQQTASVPESISRALSKREAKEILASCDTLHAATFSIMQGGYHVVEELSANSARSSV